MTSYGAVEGWGTRVTVPHGMVHLTRRGRLVRAVLVVALVMLAAVGALGRGVTAAGGDPAPAVPAAVAALRITVVEGDSLWAIARAVAPESDPREVVLEIRALNGLSSNTIQPGQVLLVPTGR